MPAPTGYHVAPLFGAAITCYLPNTFADVSALREVPDNQEVWLDTQGFTSVVVDLLERVEKPDEEALKVHLEEILEEDAGRADILGGGVAVLGRMK
jgi:hypothetical protein